MIAATTSQRSSRTAATTSEPCATSACAISGSTFSRRPRRGGDDPVVRDPEVPRTDLLLTATHTARRRRRPRRRASTGVAAPAPVLHVPVRRRLVAPARLFGLLRRGIPGTRRLLACALLPIVASPELRCLLVGQGVLLLLASAAQRCATSSIRKARCSYRFAALDTCNRTPLLIPSSCGRRIAAAARPHRFPTRLQTDPSCPGLHAANHVNVMRPRRPTDRRGRRVNRRRRG